MTRLKRSEKEEKPMNEGEEVIGKVLIQGEKAKCRSSQSRERRTSKTEHQISKRISGNVN